MERVVLDTNVLISAIISSKSSPAKILDLWREGVFELDRNLLPGRYRNQYRRPWWLFFARV